jgi:hypothetical protein
MGKILPTVIWGVVAVAGALSTFALLSQPNFGLSIANIGAWGTSILLLSFGGVKAFNIDVVKAVSVA